MRLGDEVAQWGCIGDNAPRERIVWLADVRWPGRAALVFEPRATTRPSSRKPDLAAASGTANASEGLRRMQTLVRGPVGFTLGADGLLWLAPETQRQRCTRPGRPNGAPTLAEVDALLREGRLTS